MHLADLHLGKRVNEFSMLEDQKYVLDQVLQWIDEEGIEGLLIAGDIYDRQVPSVEAVRLLDDFLTQVSRLQVPVYMIGGNHDSAARISFGARLLARSGVHMAQEYDGTVEKITVEDAFGLIDLYLLPFLRPAQVRACWQEEAEWVHTYQDAVSFVLDRVERNEEHRSILLAHQFVTGAAVCDSEEHVVGGLDQIDVSCLDGFDYVALGHLHGPQRVGRDTVRYAGTLLKYSFSEVAQKKSAVIVELREKGNILIDTRPVRPLHEMRIIRGNYEEVTCRRNYENTDTKDYVGIILTDEEDVFDAVSRLRVIYPNLMKLGYDNARTRQDQTIAAPAAVQKKGPMELSEELFMLQNNRPMSEQQKEYLGRLISEVWGR